MFDIARSNVYVLFTYDNHVYHMNYESQALKSTEIYNAYKAWWKSY